MKKETLNRVLSSLILIPLVFFFIFKGSFYFDFFISICFLITIYEWYKMNRKKIIIYCGLIFLIFSFYTVYFLRNINEDFLIFLLVLVTCIATDIGGYIFGKVFKGPKLTKISPNKTYAGMYGGFFLSIFVATIFFNYLKFDHFTLNLKASPNMSFQLFIFVILVSIVSQIGDLIISYFKRKSKIKNTGKIIPGHGGLLDRIDGMIFAFPFAYIFLKLF